MADGLPKGLGLERARRIKHSRDFAQIREKGRRLPGGCFIANWQRLPSGSPSRVGVVTSGKLGNAVQRSRARRLLREAFRIHQHELLYPVDLVLVARQSLRSKRFGLVETDFLTTLRKAGLLK